ncbi:hypothetical protein BDV37DRAFT_289288 [Aspergillus pseudonomiae]|uniref:Uncharacterized protein n=1 Tax=Aspergillus pseudonomiae TaxID=1506151 RepID=A0A5N7CTT8_9EURO|nr:uncharacterized protein BDV37DRAFT_289288 [Aspergillus pseudonomiae]KAE8397585.1 hypothetical protein BDV37DRAFT_289288 [Aspergillus pseudonomiae]
MKADNIMFGSLFTGQDPTFERYRSRAHLAELINLLGPPPSSLLAQAELRDKFFSSDGAFLTPDLLTDPVPLEKSGLPRDHHALFVETHENGSSTGHIYHVKGNMKEGMNFEHRTEQLPEDIPGFYSKKKLGVVAIAEYRCVLGICEGMPVPKKQFHGARRLYQREPLKRCQEWVAEAVNALKGEGGL